jgi:hypothetical protein
LAEQTGVVPPQAVVFPEVHSTHWLPEHTEPAGLPAQSVLVAHSTQTLFEHTSDPPQSGSVTHSTQTLPAPHTWPLSVQNTCAADVHSTQALLLHTGVFDGHMLLLVHCTAVHEPAFGPVNSQIAVPGHSLF